MFRNRLLPALMLLFRFTVLVLLERFLKSCSARSPLSSVRNGAESASYAAMPLVHSVSPPVSGSSFAARIAPAAASR
jgi:hypothetical protein